MDIKFNEPKLSKSAQKRLAALEHNKQVQANYTSDRQPTTAEREELESISKELFKATSRWQKFLKKGQPTIVTEEVTEFVPDEKHPEGGTNRQAKIPVKKNGALQLTTTHFTVDSLLDYMRNMKKQRDDILALAKAEQEKAAAQKALLEKVHSDAHGQAK